MSTDKCQWTLVTLNRRARFARPVAGAPVGSWWDANNAARELMKVVPQRVYLTDPDPVTVWYVPTEDSPQHSEDRDNLLVTDAQNRDRRVPIRWDATPRYTFPS